MQWNIQETPKPRTSIACCFCFVLFLVRLFCCSCHVTMTHCIPEMKAIAYSYVACISLRRYRHVHQIGHFPLSMYAFHIVLSISISNGAKQQKKATVSKSKVVHRSNKTTSNRAAVVTATTMTNCALIAIMTHKETARATVYIDIARRNIRKRRAANVKLPTKRHTQIYIGCADRQP